MKFVLVNLIEEEGNAMAKHSHLWIFLCVCLVLSSITSPNNKLAFAQDQLIDSVEQKYHFDHSHQLNTTDTQNVVRYTGTFTNTTVNQGGIVEIRLLIADDESISGHINFTNYPTSVTLCGAGDFQGQKSGNNINFVFTSNDLDAGCYFDKGLIFTINAVISNDKLSLEGKYTVSSGREGVFNTKVRLPVILVHGLNATAEGWEAYQKQFLPSIGLSENYIWPITVNTGGTKNFRDKFGWSTDTIDANARKLALYINAVKSATGAKQVDVVAHSMGGLITRRYINQYMKDADIHSFIMLGTPNAGSYTAEAIFNGITITSYLVLKERNNIEDVYKYLLKVGFLYPAIPELSVSYVKRFNQVNNDLKGVSTYIIAGNYVCLKFKNPFEGPVNDIVVGRDSAFEINALGKWTFPDRDVGSCEGMHTKMRDTDAGEKIFSLYVKPLLLNSTPNIPPEAEVDNKLPSLEDTYNDLTKLQFTQVQSSILQRNSRKEFVLQPEPAEETSFIVIGSPEQVRVSLRDPKGTVFTPSTSNASVKFVRFEEDYTPITVYIVTNATPGQWTVITEANSRTPEDGTPLAVFSSFNSKTRFTAFPDLNKPSVFSPMSILARVEQEETLITGATVDAVLTSPLGVMQEIKLYDDGMQGDGSANDGVYGYRFTPDTIGVYSAVLSMKGSINSVDFTRSAGTAIQVYGERVFLPIVNQ